MFTYSGQPTRRTTGHKKHMTFYSIDIYTLTCRPPVHVTPFVTYRGTATSIRLDYEVVFQPINALYPLQARSITDKCSREKRNGHIRHPPRCLLHAHQLIALLHHETVQRFGFPLSTWPYSPRCPLCACPLCACQLVALQRETVQCLSFPLSTWPFNPSMHSIPCNFNGSSTTIIFNPPLTLWPTHWGKN